VLFTSVLLDYVLFLYFSAVVNYWFVCPYSVSALHQWQRRARIHIDMWSFVTIKDIILCGSGQPGLLVGDPAHSRGLKLNAHCGPFQPRPLYDSLSNTSVKESDSEGSFAELLLWSEHFSLSKLWGLHKLCVTPDTSSCRNGPSKRMKTYRTGHWALCYLFCCGWIFLLTLQQPGRAVQKKLRLVSAWYWGSLSWMPSAMNTSGPLKSRMAISKALYIPTLLLTWFYSCALLKDFCTWKSSFFLLFCLFKEHKERGTWLAKRNTLTLLIPDLFKSYWSIASSVLLPSIMEHAIYTWFLPVPTQRCYQ